LKLTKPSVLELRSSTPVLGGMSAMATMLAEPSTVGKDEREVEDQALPVWPDVEDDCNSDG
jgi:hypothetical protein